MWTKRLAQIYESDIIKYIECSCGDFEHVIRVIYDKYYETLSFEYKVIKTPGSYVEKRLSDPKYELFYLKNHKKIKEILKVKWLNLCFYFKNIKLAIFGQPAWFRAYSELAHDQIISLCDFLTECINDQSKRKA